MDYTELLCEKKDGVVWITIKRPQSFNIDSEQRAGGAQLAHTALGLYYQTEEAMERRNAFVEKRPVDFRKFGR